ncbi:hypothetical protein RF55_12175 [Lasius niger]|uniref:Reverse transcriptase domain-containing protein n=1 Tax=Lasius niger TaxID=67767 RepID=A0A0J7KDT6_LASNI|nr:hypothetical protein RF55_12175 [Lasius niger]
MFTLTDTSPMTLTLIYVVKDMTLRVITAGFTTSNSEEAQRVQAFLAAELPKFERVQGPSDQVRLKPGPPIKQRYWPRNPATQAIIDQEFRKMEKGSVIKPSTSGWSSPIILVKKKDGDYRFCIDFRKLNAASDKNAYPLPHISVALDKLCGAR